MNTPRLQRAVFLLLLAGVTIAFLWILTPFFGAVFWAMALALLVAFGVSQRTLKMRAVQARQKASERH